MLSIVLKFISVSRTPPHVTNSSLFRLFPFTVSSVAVRVFSKLCCAVRLNADHRVSALIPAACNSSAHNREGRGASVVFVIETGWYALVALVLSSEGPRLAYLRFKTWIDRAAGGVMIALGIRLAASARL